MGNFVVMPDSEEEAYGTPPPYFICPRVDMVVRWRMNTGFTAGKLELMVNSLETKTISLQDK